MYLIVLFIYIIIFIKGICSLYILKYISFLKHILINYRDIADNGHLPVYYIKKVETIGYELSLAGINNHG